MREFPFHFIPTADLDETKKTTMMKEAVGASSIRAHGTRLTETRSELETFLQADKERLAPSEADQATSDLGSNGRARQRNRRRLHRHGNVLKELLNVVDKGVFATSDSFHAKLLAQAAEKTDKRNAVIDKQLYDELDELRRFRHRERVNYRHVLRESFVNENMELLKKAFPSFETQIVAFIESWENKPKEEDEPTSSPNI